MNFRHEIKHEINISDMMVIRQRLRAVAKPDMHTIEGRYFIRSIYFDNLFDKALREKIDGVNKREKFRIRYYNGDTSFIQLEKKSKLNGLSNKISTILTKEEAQNIIDGNLSWMLKSSNPLIYELYSKMQAEQIKPKTIVDYTREPFVYPMGNVRITIDYDIHTGLFSTDFFNSDNKGVPASKKIILEVKWDEYLPDIIRAAIQLDSRSSSAFSKYAVCRIYG